MATLTLQLTNVSGTLNPAPSNPSDTDAAITPVNANQAQSAPAPLDTVTLAAQSPQGQGTAENQQEGEFQNSSALAAAAALFANAISAASQNGNDDASKPSAVSSTLAQADSANGSSVLTGTTQQASANTARPDLTETQKQQLQQLDDTLRQLGIDPQNVSVFKQLALLFYANNPSGLEEFVRQFQATAQQGTAAASAPQNLSPATASNASANASVSSAQAGSPAAAQSAATLDNQSNVGSQQFQELQFAMAAVGGQVQLPRPSSTPDSQEPSLDITL